MLRSRQRGRVMVAVLASAAALLLLLPTLAHAAPTVTGISPASGPAGGGTQVVISGNDFASDSSVSFGGGAGVMPTSVSSTSLTVVSPAGSGTVPVTVSSQSTSTTVTAGQFTYLPLPTVTAITPTSGPPSGGTTVTVTGTGFTAGAGVQFGAVDVSAVVNSPTSLTVVSPPGTGTAAVIVITGGGISTAGPADVFSYSTTPGTGGGGQPSPPTLAVGAATALSATAATLAGTVTKGSQKILSCNFQYGTTTKFANSVPCTGHTPGSVRAKLTGLKPATTYHYRLAVTTATFKPATSEPMTFTTAPQTVVGAPRVGLLLVRVKHSRYIAQLVGIKGITGGIPGESLVLSCVKGCQHKLSATIPLRGKHDLKRKIGLLQALPVSKATRINIHLSAKGKLSQFASYQFYVSRGLIAVKIAKTGCVRGTAIVKCPSAIVA